MAQKTEYQDLEVKGTVKAEKFVNPNEPANYLLRADGMSASPFNPVNFPNGVTLRSSTEKLTNAATVIELSNFELSQIPDLLNKSLFISNNTNVVKRSERLYELIDNETGDITVVSGIVQPVLGQTLRYSAINPSGALNNLRLQLAKNGSTYAACCVYITQNIRFEKAVYKIEYYIYTNVTGDGDYNNKDNYEWKTVFEKELNQYNEVIYPLIGIVFVPGNATYTYIDNVRVSVTPTTKNNPHNINILDIDVLYHGMLHKTPVYANRLINFDAVIEPTQTSTELKSPLWLWQYLVQAVNWLRAKINNSSMSLNGTNVNLGDNVILPWYVDYNDFNYPARLRDNWLQIYRNGVWGNLMYLSGQEAIQPTQVVQITSFDNLDWYNKQVSEYEVDNNTTQSILAGTTLPAAALMNCLAEQLVLNLYPISGKKYGKGSLDSLISDLQGNGFSVFAENDLDAILASGSVYLVRLKISKVPTPKAIIECYVSR